MIVRIATSDTLKWKFAAQHSDQGATGDELLKGTDFSASQFGLKGEVAWGPALFTVAWTGTDNGTNMQNPWGGYPGYTSVQVEDFNRAGEDAFMLRARYASPAETGFSVYGLYVDGSRPDDPAQYAKTEYDLNVQWVPPTAWAKGLSLRLRYARVEQEDPGDKPMLPNPRSDADDPNINYKVFTRAFDEVIGDEDLCPPEELARLRVQWSGVARHYASP